MLDEDLIFWTKFGTCYRYVKVTLNGEWQPSHKLHGFKWLKLNFQLTQRPNAEMAVTSNWIWILVLKVLDH